jgi:UDPglucose 6-dehydrogenase
LQKLMARPLIVDLRNIYPPQEVSRYGFDYACVGRPPKSRAGSGVERRRK